MIPGRGYQYVVESPDGKYLAANDTAFSGVAVINRATQRVETVTANEVQGIQRGAFEEEVKEHSQYHGGQVHWARYPVWSSDSRRLAYVTNRGATPGEFLHDSIWIADLETGREYERLRYDRIPGRGPHVSITIHAWTKTDQLIFSSGLTLYAVDGNDEVRELHRGAARYSVSSDGKYIAAYGVGNLDIVTVDTGAVYAVPLGPDAENLLPGGWSPTGDLLAYLAYPTVYDAEQADKRQVQLHLLTMAGENGSPALRVVDSPNSGFTFAIDYQPVWATSQALIVMTNDGGTYAFDTGGGK